MGAWFTSWRFRIGTERKENGKERLILHVRPLPPSFDAPFGSVPGSNEGTEDWFPDFKDVVLRKGRERCSRKSAKA